MVPGVTGFVLTNKTFRHAFGVIPQGVTAFAQINPPLNLVLKQTVIEVPVEDPEAPEGNVHRYDVAPATGAIENTWHFPLQTIAAPEIAPGAEGQTGAQFTVAVAVAVQPLASVIVTVYVPELRPEAVAVFAPFDHKYV